MVHYGVAVSILLSVTASVQGFAPRSFLTTLQLQNGVDISSDLRRHLSASTLFPEEDDRSIQNIRNDVNKISSAYLESLSRAVTDDEEDAYEVEMALKKRLLKERSNRYEVTFPLTDTKAETAVPLGLALCQVDVGQVFSETDLDLDSLRFQAPPPGSEGTLVSMDLSEMKKRIDQNFRGIVVSSVVKGGWAWNSGVRPGDVLLSTSATMGDALWPKTTLEGVRSAIASRKVASGDIVFQFERTADEVGSHYELTLTKPLGIQIQATEDGFVEVTGFTPNAQKLVRYAVKVGDRIMAVDSAIGDRMWPVSTVEGVISACTSRLPGQPIRIRFARPFASQAGTFSEQTDVTAANLPTNAAKSAKAIAAYQTTDETLLARCRDVLRRYSAEEQQKDRVTFSGKYAVPAMVADKVLDAIASASASLDALTLSLVMNAYMSCRQPDSVIRAFEAATGFKGDGSVGPVTTIIQGKEKGSLVPNSLSLNLVTASSLMRAHALKGDVVSMQRVLAALEGRAGVIVGGIESATWPGTGVSGKIVADTQCYNIALAAAAKAGTESGVQAALTIFESMSEPRRAGARPEKDLVSYNTVIGALAKMGQSVDAFAVFYDMKKAGVKPDKFTYTSLIKACTKDGDIQELLYDMMEQGVQPDIVTYNTMIKSLCDRYQWYEAKKLITEMESRGIAPDSMTYGLLMNGLLKAKKPGPCLTLFETACADARTASLTENVHLYTTAITAASALGNHEKALDLVARMNGAGVKPNMKTMTALMSACLSSGEGKLAADVYNRIDNPDGYAMALGLRSMCAKGDLSAASALLSSERTGARTLSGKEVMASYQVLIRTALERAEYALARKSITELLSSGYIPSKSMFQTIIEALGISAPAQRRGFSSVVANEIPGEKFDFLLFVLDSIGERNLPCDGSFYSSVLQCGGRMGGLRKKIASLLAEARVATVDNNIGQKMKGRLEEDVAADERMVVSWQDLVTSYDDYKSQLGREIHLPRLAVRIGSSDVRQVLSAEQSVTYTTSRRKTRNAQVAYNKSK